ncbi:GDSL esterase/lipase At3g14820 [Linum perenne]
MSILAVATALELSNSPCLVLRILLVGCLLIVLLNSTAAVNISNYYINGGESSSVPAVFVLGDSLLDTGNNNYILTIVKSNIPPYGRDFPGHIPTGRPSNGRAFPDFIAEAFGVKKLVPPYLDPTLDIHQLLTGVSFASSASGYDPLTFETSNAISPDAQVGMLREYVTRMTAEVGVERTSSIISESAYFTFSGSNDISITYPLLRSHQYDINSYTDLLITLAVDFHKVRFLTTIYSTASKQKLYEVGARKIGVLSIPPTGCLPAIRTTDGGLERICSEKMNEAVKLFNSKLTSAIAKLNQQLPGARIVLVDLYNPVLSLIQNPTPYGIEEVKRGCCGTGNIEVGILCVIPGTCPDASKYLFWDGAHPTEAASSIIVSQAFSSNPTKLFS